MLKLVRIKNLKPNPFRRTTEYPIQRKKIDALKESIESTEFWGNLLGREMRGGVEIAYGHHRLKALQELFDKNDTVEINVRPLSNELMLQIMARENMEEWGTSAWVELESVRTCLEAAARGDIKLPPISNRGGNVKTYKPLTISADFAEINVLKYTEISVAECIGWTTKNKNGREPNVECRVAFDALLAIDGKRSF